MPCHEAAQLLWGCYFCFVSHHLSKQNRISACAVNNNKKKKNLFQMTMLHFWPFISLPTIKEFTLKSPTFCNCLRARTALKPGLNYKVLLTKLFQSQAWKNHTLNWYRYASNTLCIDARISLLAWLMSLKKVVEEKRLLSPVCIFPLVQLSQQSLCIMDQWFPNFL